MTFIGELAEENYRVSVTVTDWMATFGGSDASNAYRQLKEAADRLMKTQIKIKDADGAYRKMQWVGECDYIEKQGKVIVLWYQGIRQDIANLGGGDFTPVDLLATSDMKSIYSIRIYELCRRWKTTGLVRIKLADLKMMLGVSDKHALFSSFRRIVLDKAVGEIRDTKAMPTLKWKPIKNGSTITTIEFTFKREI
jgi:plasmid replication initiation protein